METLEGKEIQLEQIVIGGSSENLICFLPWLPKFATIQIKQKLIQRMAATFYVAKEGETEKLRRRG
jgi:hypothetical protein